jgi:hypothetical protein
VPCKGGWLGAKERARGIYSLPSFSNVVFVVEYSGEERREGTRGLSSVPPFTFTFTLSRRDHSPK